MKKTVFSIALAIGISLSVSAQINLKDALGSLAGKTSGESSLGNALGVISSIVGTGDIKPETLVGKWTYSKPAVTFQSDNLLQKAGGAAASQMIVNKITPYYNRIGVKGLTMEFTKEGEFTINRGAVNIKGTYEAGEKGKYILNIKALGKIPAGKLNVYISGNSSTIQVTCAADKLLAFASKVGSMTGNASLKSLSTILDTYQGLNIGIELKK